MNSCPTTRPGYGPPKLSVMVGACLVSSSHITPGVRCPGINTSVSSRRRLSAHMIRASTSWYGASFRTIWVFREGHLHNSKLLHKTIMIRKGTTRNIKHWSSFLFLLYVLYEVSIYHSSTAFEYTTGMFRSVQGDVTILRESLLVVLNFFLGRGRINAGVYKYPIYEIV
jgi:hypothetical protein